MNKGNCTANKTLTTKEGWRKNKTKEHKKSPTPNTQQNKINKGLPACFVQKH